MKASLHQVLRKSSAECGNSYKDDLKQMVDDILFMN